MTVAELNLKQTREKMASKQDELGKVFAEALVSGDSGKKEYDFNRVVCLGTGVKGSVAVAKRVQEMNAELNELGEHADTLEAAEKAAAEHESREKARPRFPMPGSKGVDGNSQFKIKSLGELVSEEKAYQDWAAKGAANGISFSYDDVWACAPPWSSSAPPRSARSRRSDPTRVMREVGRGRAAPAGDFPPI